MGTPLQSLIFDHGGGMLEGEAFKALFTGGPSNPLRGRGLPRGGVAPTAANAANRTFCPSAGCLRSARHRLGRAQPRSSMPYLRILSNRVVLAICRASAAREMLPCWRRSSSPMRPRS